MSVVDDAWPDLYNVDVRIDNSVYIAKYSHAYWPLAAARLGAPYNCAINFLSFADKTVLYGTPFG